MDAEKINKTFVEYVAGQEIAGGALLVRRGDEILFENHWGYSNIAAKKPIVIDSIYRMMSMTKCITAVAVMICVERGLIGLEDPVSKYVPEFKNLQVMDDSRYEFTPENLKKLPIRFLTFRMDKVKRTPAKREITITDLLSHSSGLQQGLAGLLAMKKDKGGYRTLEEDVLHYASHVLDFEPGTSASYSPLAGFDTLGYIVSLVSGKSFENFVQEEICRPLGMADTTFFLNEEQKKRLVHVYKQNKGKTALVDVTGTKDDMAGFFHDKEVRYEHGCGGIYSTLEDYDKFGRMLLNKGTGWNEGENGERTEVPILKPESVALLHTKAPHGAIPSEPGFAWGLGLKIREDPKLGNSHATAGTYGWSGAFGTHFFVSPADDLEVVFMTNRSDLNGSGSYISAKVEELVFEK